MDDEALKRPWDIWYSEEELAYAIYFRRFFL